MKYSLRNISHLFCFGLFLFGMNSQLIAQNDNVGIGTSAPDQSAILDISSTEKGLLIPRLTTTQQGLVSNPAEGLMIYNSAENKLKYYHSGWKKVSPWESNGNKIYTLSGSSVGIGGGAPDNDALLHLKFGGTQLGLRMTATTGTTWYTYLDVNGDYVIKNSGTNFFSIQNNTGNVGIGVAPSSNHKLRLNGMDNNGTDATLKITSGNQNMLFDGNEIDTDGPLYINNNSDNDVVFGYSSAASARVGIGLLPTKGRLHVSGSNVSYSATGYYWDGGNMGCTLLFVDPGTQLPFADCANEYSGNVTASIHADGYIVSQGTFIESDARIKNIQGISNSLADLKIVKNIEITDYTMKDFIANGNKSYKKVIAQQVKEVFPKAVSTSTNEIPDIYQPTTIENGWVNLTTDLQIGEKVKLIFGKERALFEVLEIKVNGFKVATEQTGEVFVYGRQVDDFHTVDYDALSMLNISATQEIVKQLETLQAKNKEQVDKIADLEQQLDNFKALSTRIAKVEAMLHQTAPSIRNNTASEK
jgi:hypothetical protein